MELEFCLSNFTSLKTKNEWNTLKELCEYGNNEDIVREWLSLCEIEDNINATFMNTLDGGIMLPDTNVVRFRYCLTGSETDDSIILNYIIVDDILTHVDKIINSARDLLFGFIKMANNRLGGEYVSGKLNLSKLDPLCYSSDSE
jgi:hypothetical protein